MSPLQAGQKNGSLSAADLLAERLPLVDRIVGSVCRRNRWRDEEAEDFRSAVMVKLLEGDGAAIRSFDGRSGCSEKTYLATVIGRFAVDYQRQKWGRWRPSAAARRLGRVAQMLETEIARDGRSFDEAAELLRRNHGVERSVSELAELWGRLCDRSPRPRVDQPADDGEIERFAAAEQADEGVLQRERAERLAALEAAVAAALARLPPKDQLVLKMRFYSGFTVAQISRALKLEQRPLYRRIEKLLRALRKRLRAAGAEVDSDELEELLA
jgi:RNA polymerase sigma factor (sigma-70 family)